MAGKTIGDEIKRAMKPYFNYIEGCRKGKVTRVNGDGTVKVSTTGEANIPVLTPCYGVIEEINLSVGDYVLIAFIKGQFGNPVVVGRF